VPPPALLVPPELQAASSAPAVTAAAIKPS